MSAIFSVVRRAASNVEAFRPLFEDFSKFLSRSGVFWGVSRNYSVKDDPNIVFSPFGTVTIPNITFHDFVTQNWSLWEKKTAIHCVATNKKYSFREIRDNSKVLAAAFQNKFNIVKGDFIAVILVNCVEFPVSILAASRIGAICTTVNPNYTFDEIKKQLGESNPKVILTNIDTYEKCNEVAKALNIKNPVVVIKWFPQEPTPEGAISFFDLIKSFDGGSFRHVDVKPEDILVVPYSSGTTGMPKGVLLTHRNIVANLVQIGHPETIIFQPTTKFHQDVIIGVLPFFHIYGLTVVLFGTLSQGCRLLTLHRFNPKLFIESIVRKKVKIIFAVPLLVTMLARKAVRGKYLKRVAYLVNGSASLVTEDARQLLNKAEHLKIVQAYGMTEASPAISHMHSMRLQKLSSVGVPIASTKMKILDPVTGQSLPHGKHGELVALGPQVMKGYLKNPEATKLAVDEEGWLRTGDIGYYDEDGDFFIVARLKELIKVKGFQVAPAELVEVLKSHPNIVDAAVVGVPHEEFGEVPRAFVKLKVGVHMSEDDVKDFIKKKLSAHKQLRGGVVFLKNIPRSDTGKVLVGELKKK